MHDNDLDLENGPISNVNMPIERQYMTSYLIILMTIVIYTLSLTIYETFVNQIKCYTFDLENDC